ncbi:MAG: HIT domain-containing protein [Haloarculaceae archaeon]
MAPCAFCDVVAGELDAHVLYEDERTMAFLDDDPAAPGHALVVPRAHREELLTGGEATAMAVFRTVHRVAVAVDRALEPDGLSVFYTSGAFVGRIAHAHVHLIPRRTDDDIHVGLDREPLDEEGTDLAASIREEV